MSGIEPEAFRMRNGHSTTELHPRWYHVYLVKLLLLIGC